MVAPKDVDRTDFFSSWYAKLQALAEGENPDVVELHMVPSAFVPVIKCIYKGVDLDLLFCSLAQESVSNHENYADINIISSIQEKCVVSLNGTRVTDDIMHLIPSIPSFQQTLRCIKAWAKRRGIYSNVLGYPGGVAWAIMTARTCQFFPNACPAVLVEKFFWFCENWKWEKWEHAHNKIELCKQQNLDVRPDMPQFAEQVAQSPDTVAWMPIITPTYPNTNATFNVMESTIWVIRKEFSRGRAITEAIKAGNASYPDLLERKCFFSKRSDPSYKTFIEIIAHAGDEMGLLVFKGVVVSSIRTFIDKVMAHRDGLNPHVVLVPCTREFAHPEKETITITDDETGEETPAEVVSCSWFLGVTWRNDVKPDEGGELDLKAAIDQLRKTILRKRYLDQKGGWNMYGDSKMGHDIKVHDHREKLPGYTGYSYAQEKVEIKEEKRREKRRLKTLKAKGLLPQTAVVKAEPVTAAATAAVVATAEAGGGGSAADDGASNDGTDGGAKRKREDENAAGGGGGGSGSSADTDDDGTSKDPDAKKAKAADSPHKGAILEDVGAAWQTSATATAAVAAKILKMETSPPKPKFSLQLGGL